MSSSIGNDRTVEKGLKKLKAAQKCALYDHVFEKRGFWMNGKFYPDGMALLDWTSRYNRKY